ncbi:MAG: hypothetical protein ACPGTQ_08145 [Colwellia sp.]
MKYLSLNTVYCLDAFPQTLTEFLSTTGTVNIDSNTISGRSVNFTTLQTITEMAQRFLGRKFEVWFSDISGLPPVRQQKEELVEGTKLLSNFFDLFITLTSIRRVVSKSGH